MAGHSTVHTIYNLASIAEAFGGFWASLFEDFLNALNCRLPTQTWWLKTKQIAQHNKNAFWRIIKYPRNYCNVQNYIELKNENLDCFCDVTTRQDVE